MNKQTIPKNSFIKQNWFGLLTVLFTLIVFMSFIFTTDSFYRLIIALEGLELKWVCMFFLSILAYWFFDALILKLFANILYKKYSLANAFHVAMIGLFYSALTPFAGGGQPMQIYQMSKHNIKAGDGSSMIAMKSIVFQTTMTILGIVGGVFCWEHFEHSIEYFKLAFFFGIITNGLFIGFVLFACLSNKRISQFSHLLIAFLHKLKLVKNLQTAQTKTDVQLSIFHQGFSYIKKQKPVVFLAFFLTTIELFFYIVIPYFIYRSFGMNETPFFQFLYTSALILMIASFFPLPGGSGAVEGSFYVFFSLFLPKDILFHALVIWRFVTYYLCILVGGLLQIIYVLSSKLSFLTAANTTKKNY